MADVGTMIATLGVTTKGIQEAKAQMLGMLTSVSKQVDATNKKLSNLGIGVGAPFVSLEDQLKRNKMSMANYTKFMGVSAQRLRTFGYLSTAFLTMPIVGAGKAIVQTSKEFEFSMQKIVGLAGVGQESVNKWRESVLQLATVVGKSPQELAEGLYFIASSGIKGSKALDVLTVSAQAAMAGLGQTKDIADVLTSALNAYAGTGLTATRAADVLVAAVREGKGEAEDFASAMGQIIPIAANVGVSFDQLAGGMAAITLTGSSAANAAVYLKGVMNSLLKAVPGGETALAKLGTSYEELRKILGSGPQGLINVMQKLKDIESEYGAAVVSDVLPNIRGLTFYMSLTGKNFKYNTELMKRVTNSSGSLAVAVAAVSDTLKVKLDIALAKTQVAMIKLGETMGPAIIKLLERLVNWLEKVTKKWDALTEAQQRFRLSAVAVAAALGPISMGLSTLMYTILGATNIVYGLGKAVKWLMTTTVAFGAASKVAKVATAALGAAAASSGASIMAQTTAISTAAAGIGYWGAESATAATATTAAGTAAAASAPAWLVMAGALAVVAAQVAVFLLVTRGMRRRMKEMKAATREMQEAMDFTDPIQALEDKFYEAKWIDTDKVAYRVKDSLNGIIREVKVPFNAWKAMTLDQLQEQESAAGAIIKLREDDIKNLKDYGQQKIRESEFVKSRLGQIRTLEDRLTRLQSKRPQYTPGIIPQGPSDRELKISNNILKLKREINVYTIDQIGQNGLLIQSEKEKIKVMEGEQKTVREMMTQSIALTAAEQQRVELATEIQNAYDDIAKGLQTTKDLESLLGDEYDYNTETLRVYEDGLKSLAATTENLSSKRFKKFFEGLMRARLAMSDLSFVTKELDDQLKKSLQSNKASEFTFGADFDLPEEDLKAYEEAINSINTLIRESMKLDPFQMMSLASHPDMVKSLWLLAEWTKKYEEIKTSMQNVEDTKTLRFLDAQAKQFGGMENQLELLNARLQISERQLRTIGEDEGFSAAFKKKAAEVNAFRQAVKDLSDQMELTFAQDKFKAFKTGSAYVDLLQTEIGILNNRMSDLSKLGGKDFEMGEIAKEIEKLSHQSDAIELLTDSFTDLFSIGKEGFENFGDYIKDWVKDLGTSLQRLLAQYLAEKLVGAISGAFKKKDEYSASIMDKLLAMFGDSKIADTAAALASSRALGQAKAFEALATAVASAAAMGYPALMVSIPMAAKMVTGTLALGAVSTTATAAVGTGVKMATGGAVPPGYPNDSFPAMLTSGEVVIPKEKVKDPQYIAEVLDVPGFAAGLGELNIPNRLLAKFWKEMEGMFASVGKGRQMSIPITERANVSPYLLKQSPEQQKLAVEAINRANAYSKAYWNAPETKTRIHSLAEEYGDPEMEARLLDRIKRQQYKASLVKGRKDLWPEGWDLFEKAGGAVSDFELKRRSSYTGDFTHLDNLVHAGFTPEEIFNIAIHEGSHGITQEVNELTPFLNADLQKYMSSLINEKSFADEGDLTAFGKYKYYSEPSELWARIIELRKYENIKPGQTVSSDMAEGMLEKGREGKYFIESEFFDSIKNTKLFQDILNKLPAVGGAAIGVGALGMGGKASAAGAYKTGAYTTDSPEYKALYESKHFAGYNTKTEEYSAPMLPEVTVTAERKKDWASYIAKQYADVKDPARMLTMPFEMMMQAPQIMGGQLFTGKAQIPSEAYDLKGWKGMLADMIIDPTNIPLGGIAKSLIKTPKLFKGIGSTLTKALKPHTKGVLAEASTIVEMVGNPLGSWKGHYASSYEEKAMKDAIEWVRKWYSSPEVDKKLKTLDKRLLKDDTRTYFRETYGEGTEWGRILERIQNPETLKARFLPLEEFKANPSEWNGVAGRYSHESNLATVKTGLGYTETLYAAIHEIIHKITVGDDNIPLGFQRYMRSAMFKPKAFLKEVDNMSPHYADAVERGLITAGKTQEKTTNPYFTKLRGAQYFRDPTEMYARIGEIRKSFDLRPGQEVDPRMFNTIMAQGKGGILPVDPAFFFMMKRPEVFRNLMNTLPALGGLTLGATTLGASQFNDNTPKLQGGGIIPQGYPNDTYPAWLTSGEAVVPPNVLADIQLALQNKYAADPIVQAMTKEEKVWHDYTYARGGYMKTIEQVNKPIQIDPTQYFKVVDLEGNKAGLRHGAIVYKDILADLAKAAALENVPLVEALTTAMRESGIGHNVLERGTTEYKPQEVMQSWGSDTMKGMPLEWDQYRMKNNLVDPKYIRKETRGYDVYEPDAIYQKSIRKYATKYLDYLNSFEIDPALLEPFRKEMKFLKEHLGQNYNPLEKEREERLAKDREVVLKNLDMYNFADSVYKANKPRVAGLLGGGEVPPGYPNDSYRAGLTSGEVVVPDITAFTNLTKSIKELINVIDTAGGRTQETPQLAFANGAPDFGVMASSKPPAMFPKTNETTGPLTPEQIAASQKAVQEYYKTMSDTSEVNKNIAGVSQGFATLAQFTEGSTQSWMGYMSSVLGTLPGIISGVNALTVAKEGQKSASVAAAGAGAVENATQYPGPLMLVMLAVNVAALIGALASAPKMAAGGIIPPGYNNDSFHAMLSSGEAVIPLNKMGDTFGETNNVVEFRIKGDDLVGIHDKRKKTKSKF
jgi:TP901 family phage tail tape measure protein